MKTEIEEQKPNTKFGDMDQGSLFYADEKLWVKCNDALSMSLDGKGETWKFLNTETVQEVLSIKATIRG